MKTLFSKKELKQSLFNNISLMARGSVRRVPRMPLEYKWVEFHEIEALRKEDWYLFNDQKRLLYRQHMLGQAKKAAKEAESK